jgi:1,4-alpha-glucan branching enzyme
MALKPTAKKSTKIPARKPSVARTATPTRTATAKAAPDNTLPVTFRFHAPQAGAVKLAGDFTQWESAPLALKREGNGEWSTTVKLAPGRYEYRLLVDGQWQNDPQCHELMPNQFGTANCVRAVSA